MENVTIEKLESTSLEDIAALAEKYKGKSIDVVILNAGIMGGKGTFANGID